MLSDKKLVIVLSQQRSGSHYFKSLLKNSEGFHVFNGEVLFPEFFGVEEEAGFFDFFYKKIMEDKNNLLITDFEGVDKIFFDYFVFASRVATKSNVVFDFKIDQVRSFGRFYNFISSRDFKVILLARRNSIARALSYERVRRFMRQDGEVRSDANIHQSKLHLKPFEVDIDGIIKMAVADYGEINWVQNVIASNGSKFLKVFYEDLSALPENSHAFSNLEYFLGVNSISRVATTVRQSAKNIGDDYLNYNELMMEVERRQLNYLISG